MTSRKTKFQFSNTKCFLENGETCRPHAKCMPLPQVLCDMHPDGGWTVIQSRDWGRGRPLDFERCWQEYKQGFGDLRGRTHSCGDQADSGGGQRWPVPQLCCLMACPRR